MPAFISKGLKTSALPLLISIFLIGCSDYAKEDLLGKWKVNSWTIPATQQAISAKMDMEYLKDGRYTVDYGPAVEKGKYWVTGGFLHTVEDDRAEKKVQILSLNKDTLVIEMNRAGQIEKVVMVR